MVSDRPGFRFIIEKSDEISELDIEAIMGVYRSANQPEQYSFVKDRVKSSSQ